MTSRRAGQVVLCAVAGGAAAMGFLGTFTAADLAGPVVAGALGAAIVGATTWRVRSPATAASLHVVAGVATFVLLVARDAPDGPLGALGQALTDGWSRLLTSVVPAPPDAVLLAAPFALAWAGTAGATELCHRRRSTVLPVLPPVAVAVVAELAGPTNAAVPLTGALVLVAAGTALGVIRTATAGPPGAPPASPRALRRGLRRMAPTLAAMMAVGAVAGASLAGPGSGEHWRLRQVADGPRREPAVLHPLSRLATEQSDRPGDGVDDRDAVVLRIRLDRPAPATIDAAGDPVLHLPMAAYDRYDGVTWSSSEPYRPVGPTLPDELVQPAERTTVRVDQRIEVVDLDGPWLPTLAGPRRLDDDGAADVRHDALAGTLAADRAPVPGSVFSVTSAVPVLEAATAAGTPPGAPPGPVDFTDLSVGGADLEPDLGRVRQVAHQLFAVPVPYPEQLQALSDLFHNQRPDVASVLSLPPDALVRGPGRAFAWPDAERAGPVSVPADVNDAVLNETPTGHAIGRINTFLYLPQADGSPAPNAGLGTPEQFATAAALIARAQGIPARLVVGYTVAYRGATSFEVRRGDADAWIEIWSPRGGWHPVDTTPVPLGVDALEPTTTTSSTAPAPSPATVTPTAPPAVVATATPTDPRRTSGLDRLAVGVAAALVATLMVLAALALVVRTRRKARSRGTPTARLAGAWEEAVHTVQVAGVPVAASNSTTEVVAAAAGDGLPVDDLRALARIVQRGAHGPGEPTASDAGMAWHHAAGLRHQVGRSAPTRARLRLLLDPRRPPRRAGPVPPPSLPSPETPPPPLAGVGAAPGGTRADRSRS